MLGLKHLLRSNLRQSSLTAQLKQFSLSSTARNSSDDEDNVADRKPKSKTDEKQKQAISKLNALLSAMVEEDKTLAETRKQAVLSRPKRVPKKVVPERKPVLGSRVEAAAKSAAASLGGDVAKTESDLLSRLRSQVAAEQSLVKPEPIVERSEESRRETARSLTSLLSAMQVEKKPARKTEEPHRGSRSLDGEEPERVVLFGNECLNIFKTDSVPAPVPMLATWQRCLDRELRLASTHPPANHFEEMIQWTEQGKLWQFPVDNEQEMAAEKDTCFTEHVFFESALEGWCTSPEVRHFMDLVCVGLSKNPYITSKDKLAHIEWFRNYFADKGHLIDGGSPTPQQAISQ